MIRSYFDIRVDGDGNDAVVKVFMAIVFDIIDVCSGVSIAGDILAQDFVHFDEGTIRQGFLILSLLS